MNRETLANLWRNELIISLASIICMLAYIWHIRHETDAWTWALTAFMLLNLRLVMLIRLRHA